MKTQILRSHLLSLSLLLLAHTGAFAQTAPFAYQGRLTEAGNPSTGTFEMQFKLFDTADVGTGTQQGATITNSAVLASNGVFTVTLDFGVSVFDGSPRFLEISVKRANTANPPSLLAPRQAVTPIPYAIHSLSASQLDGMPSTSFVQADASGSVGIGTANPAAGVRLEVNGPTRVTPGGSGGFMQLGAPGGETGLSIIGSNRFDLRFNGETVALAAAANAGPPPYYNGIVLNTNGNVGIGMEAPFPASLWKLEINGRTRITPGGSGGAIQFSTPNGETGMTILGQNRVDLRFNDSILKLVAGPGNSAPSMASGLAIHTSGSVGIGTTAIDPNIKLEVRSANGFAVFGRSGFEGVHGESTSDVAAGVAGINTGKGIGVYGQNNSDTHGAIVGFNRGKGPGVRGESTGGGVGIHGISAGVSSAVYGESTGAAAGVYGKSATGPAVYAEGNASQPPDKGGFVKAMANVNPFLPADQYVVHCYNSQQAGAAMNAAPCGIKVTRSSVGRYQVDFGFNIDNRFVSVTTRSPICCFSGSTGGGFTIGAVFRRLGNAVEVLTARIDAPDEGADSEFYIFVF